MSEGMLALLEVSLKRFSGAGMRYLRASAMLEMVFTIPIVLCCYVFQC